MANILRQASQGFAAVTHKVLGEVAHVVKPSEHQLTEILSEFHLPHGLFPINFSSHTWERNMYTGTLTVRMPGTMEITFLDGTVLRYRPTVVAAVEKGRLNVVEGIQLKGYLGVWTKVTSIWVEDPPADTIYFQTVIQLTKKLEVFEKPREALEIL